MNSTKLTAEDICRIIEASAKANVARIVLGKIQIDFGFKADQAPEFQSVPLPPPSDQRELNNEYARQSNELAERAELEHLLVLDPVEYERRLLDGELEENGQPR